MIVREFYKTREDGVNLYRTYSDTIHYIKQIETGNVYSEAVDVEDAPYTYIETEDVFEVEENKAEKEEYEKAQEEKAKAKQEEISIE